MEQIRLHKHLKQLMLSAAIAAASIALSGCGGSSMGQSFSGIGADHGLAAIQRSGTPRFLYAVNPIGDIASYQLPLKTGESPAVTLAVTTAGLTNDSNYLYASTRNGLKVAAYPLPLTPSETPATTLAVRGSGAETVAGHFLYVGL